MFGVFGAAAATAILFNESPVRLCRMGMTGQLIVYLLVLASSLIAVQYASSLQFGPRNRFATLLRMPTHGVMFLAILGIVYQPARRRFWYGVGISIWWYLFAYTRGWAKGPGHWLESNWNYHDGAAAVANYLWILFAAYHIGLVVSRLAGKRLPNVEKTKGVGFQSTT